MCPQQVKTFGDTGQHPQRQNIHLEDAQGINVILVPFDKTALGHRAVSNRHHLGQGPFGQDKSAHMLA